MQPFTMKTLYSLLLASGAYGICFFMMRDISGFLGLIIRSAAFSAVMISGIFYFKLTPDAGQLYHVFLKKIGKAKD
jgi:hypothetical protein